MNDKLVKHKSLTAKDWEKLWDEIEDKEYFAVESKFQDDMCKRHGPGHYYLDDEEYWKRKKLFIQRTVNRRIKEKNA